jgi:virginiamycin A acetyltransferase
MKHTGRRAARPKGSPSMLSGLLFRAYRTENNRLRRFLLGLAARLEDGEMYSQTMRRIFREYHRVEIGMYTHGSCFELSHVDPCTKIGRYCSIAADVRIFNQNHPMGFRSTHGFFFNHALEFCSEYLVRLIPLEVGNDVWIGCRAIIMPNVRSIGDGAVIAAGAVVNKDVPPYAIVCGNPARVVRYRFEPDTVRLLRESRWWERSIEELESVKQDFLRPLQEEDPEIVSAGGT